VEQQKMDPRVRSYEIAKRRFGCLASHETGGPNLNLAVAIRSELLVGRNRDVCRPAKVSIRGAGQRWVGMARRDQHREARTAQGLEDKGCCFAGDVIVFEEVTGAGDEVDLCLLGSFHDSPEGAAKRLSMLLSAGAIEAFTRKRSIEMQVGEMEQAKGHKSPVSTQNQLGATSPTSAKQEPL